MYKLTKFGAKELKVNKQKKKYPDALYCRFPFIMHNNPIKLGLDSLFKWATIEFNTLNIIEYDEEALAYLIEKNMVEKVEEKK